MSSSSDQAQGMPTKGSDADAAASAEPPAKAEASGSSSGGGAKVANGDAERAHSASASNSGLSSTTPASPSLTISTFEDAESSANQPPTSTTGGASLRQPAPIRPGDGLSPSASPSYAPHKHHHQRSRSVNLSPVMRVGSFVPPPSSPKGAPGGINLNLAWEHHWPPQASGSGSSGASSSSSSGSGSGSNAAAQHHVANGMDPRHRAASPLNLGGPLKVPATRPASVDSGHSFPPHLDRHLHSRSPETSTQARRGIHASSSANRNASPARVWAMPVSPRLKAFGSDRMRRSSSSSSSGSNSSSSSGDKALHTSSSPPNRPASPVPGPINPDPEHAFDSIWPSDAAVASSSPSSPQRHRGELLHNWMMDRRRSESRSPHADAQRSIPPRSAFSSSPGSAGSASPILMRGGGPFGGHRKSLSGSSSNSSASPTIAVSMLEPPAPSSTPPPGSLGLHRSASNPGFNGALAAPPRGSPVSRFISPTTSSIKLDAQSVLAQVTPSGESPPTSPRSPRSPSAQLPSGSGISESLAYPQRRGSLNNGRPRSLGPSDASPTSPSGFSGSPSFARSPSPFAKSSGSGTSPTPTPPSITSESPPKTRSFIGMPPRSGYELSDDPDDVGSEDGTSSSVSSGGKEDSMSQTTDDDDEERRIARHEDDEDEERDDLEEQGRETEAFEADEEDALANERRKENGEHEQQSSGETASSSSSSSTIRPSLPKRPSLTRSSAVPSMPPTPPAQPTSALRHFDLGLASANDASMWHHPPTENADNAPPADGNDSLLDGITIPPPDPAEAQRPTADSQPIASAVLAAMEGDDHDEEGEGEGHEGEGDDGEEAPGGTAGAATEESLSTLERIFLFAKSEMTYHRIIVSRSLPMWIREVELTEAVEYVIALLNGLATDDVDVCTAFAGELDQILWFFFLNCPLAESDALGGGDDDETKATRPRLPVGVFTPLICALLLNQNATVAQTAQTALVQFFQRLNAAAAADDTDGLVRHAAGREGELVEYEQYRLDDDVKRMVANELLEHVAFAMGRQSRDEGASNNEASDASKPAENGATAGNEAVDEPLGQRVDEMQPHSATDGDEDSSWDAEMREDGDIDIGGLAADDWRKISSPFDSSSPVFEAYERADIDEEAAVGRMASVSLIGALSSESDAVSSSTVSQRFLPEVLALHEDPAFYVRKEVAMALGPISKHLEEEQVLQTLVPCFEVLCADKIWHVRQAATTSLPAIFGRLTGQQRRDAVVKLMRGFSRDVSRNVRATALEIIGEAIYLFHGDEGGVPAELVRFFLDEPFDIEEEEDSRGAPANNSENQDGSEGSFLFADFDFASAMNGGTQTAKQSSTPGNGSIETGPTVSWERPDYSAAFDDADRPLVMAYNFPAVVLTLGGDASWPRLRSAHNRLILDGAPKVRQSLAASLHEIAKLVGEETVRDDLVPVFERLVATDEESEVKAALLENANVLLARAPRDVALHQLSLLRDLWSTSFASDWRLREAMALQVPLLADTFVGIDDEGCLMSIMQAALCDAISSVRDAGVKAVPALYRNFVLQHDQTIADGVLGMLSDMGEARSYRVRVGFLRAVEALVRVGEDGEEKEEENRGGRLNAASFRLIVLPRLMELVNDHVIDVRLALSSLATAICHRHHEVNREDVDEGGFSRSPRMVDLLRTLSRDWSLEVRQPVLEVLALMFGQDDPISQCGEGEENERVPRSRSELVLGPANGGPHRPPPSENGHGDAGTLTTMMDFDQEGEDDDDEGRGSDDDGDEDQHRVEPFQMDEDDQESQPYNSLQQRQRRSRHRSHQINGHRGFEEEDDDDDDGGMADDLLDSDLEMVNLDDAAEHRGDGGEDVGDATMIDDRSGGSGSGNSGDGNALGLETPSAADDSFSSSDSGDAGAGAAGDVMYLTSPERPRDAWNGQYFGSVASSGEEEGKQMAKESRTDEADSDGGSDDGEAEQDEPKPSSTDPFLSFVSSNLGGGAKKGRKFKRHKSSEAVPREDDGGAGEGEGEAAAGVEEKEGA